MQRQDAVQLLAELPKLVKFNGVERALRIPDGSINEAIQVVSQDGIDNLATLLEIQKVFMELLEIPDPETIGDEYLRNSYFTNAVVSLVGESAEVLDALWTVTKPWKHKTEDEIREHVIEELTDVLFMMLEVFALAQISSEQIMTLYAGKLQKNLGRIGTSGSSNAAQAISWRLQLAGKITDNETIRDMLYDGNNFVNFQVTQRQRLGGARRVTITGNYSDKKWGVISEDGYMKGKEYSVGEDELIKAIQEELGYDNR